MFAVLTYIAPTVTGAGGLPSSAVPVFLLVFGLGMVAGTWLAGELADWSIFRSLLGSALGMGLVLLLFAAVVRYGWWALPMRSAPGSAAWSSLPGSAIAPRRADTG